MKLGLQPSDFYWAC